MKIVLTGPFDTDAFRLLTGLDLAGAPAGTGGMPVTDLAAGLREIGIHVTVVTLDANIDDTFRVEDDGVTVVYCPLRGAPRYRARTRTMDLFELEIRHLTREIKAENPDIVHAHWTYEYAEAAVRSGRPHIVTMHDLGWNYLWQFRDPYRFMRLVMKYRAMSRIEHLTVVAPFMVPKARQYGYFGPVNAIPNGVEIPEPPDIGGRDLNRPILVTVGNPTRIKNVANSIRAFALIRERLPDAEIHLFGPGLDEAYARGGPGIVPHGNVAHGVLMDFLSRRATLLLQPSRFECCPMITIEAKARGIPVVGGVRSGGVAYVCDDGANRIVDIENPREIADAALSLLTDKQTYLHAARVSREDCERRFSTSGVTDQYLSLYLQILSKDWKGLETP